MKYRLLALALLMAGGASAQNPYISLQGATETASGVQVSDPRTILAVDLTVEQNVVLSGPYARYAQKFLNMRGSLVDKTVYSLKGVKLAVTGGEDVIADAVPAAEVTETSYMGSASEFAKVLPDRMSATAVSEEEAAANAAQAIFSIRKHRMDLITGEAGENVFGAGLEAALAEIDRQEQAYLELFLGKRILSTETRRYVVYPQSDKKQYIFCRFSPAAGLLPENDLSGDIVLLQIEPSGARVAADLEAGPKESNVVTCRVADPSTCTVVSGGGEYARAVLPVFEFGRTINVALPRRK